ncbi:MAG: hypothetical protein AVDCRST_MAG73-1998, partial [uncultured Thermomicrobiales bacterium]
CSASERLRRRGPAFQRRGSVPPGRPKPGSATEQTSKRPRPKATARGCGTDFPGVASGAQAVPCPRPKA